MEYARQMQTELSTARAQGCRQYRALDLDSFWRHRGGKMLGVLAAREPISREFRVLRAFSGQWMGRWRVAGWAEPLFCVEHWKALEARHDPEIKALGRRLEDPDLDPDTRKKIKQERRELSLQLQDAYFDLVDLPSERGKTRPLRDFWPQSRPPTGAGDCCAPKLIAAAIRRGWDIDSMAEFYWGDSGSNAKISGEFYSPCLEKCVPILDFMLDGQCKSAEGA